MLKGISELFGNIIPIGSEIWLYILLAIVGATFLITLIIGLVAGEFKQVKSLMKQAASHPQSAVSAMKQMPVAIKKQYKHARMINSEPSMFVSEQLCVDAPYKRSLLSKVWLATFVATAICALFGYFVAAITDSIGLATVPLTILLVGGLLTLIGAIIGRVSYGGARKTYVSFVAAIDGEKPVADFGIPSQPEPTSFDRSSEPNPVMGNYVGADQAPETVYADAEATAFAERAAQPFEAQAEPINAEPVYGGYAEPVQDVYVEPQQAYAEPVHAEPVVEPVVTVAQEESEAEIRRRAREEALAQARAAQQAQAAQAAAAQAQAAQAAAQAQAAAAQAQAAAQAAAQAQAAQAQAQAAQGSSSADDIIARIEQIDREGAPRETMREVATLLQKERSKPENKTPEQQKKLNEALSKLLKAMSSANRK